MRLIWKKKLKNSSGIPDGALSTFNCSTTEHTSLERLAQRVLRNGMLYASLIAFLPARNSPWRAHYNSPNAARKPCPAAVCFSRSFDSNMRRSLFFASNADNYILSFFSNVASDSLKRLRLLLLIREIYCAIPYVRADGIHGTRVPHSEVIGEYSLGPESAWNITPNEFVFVYIYCVLAP